MVASWCWALFYFSKTHLRSGNTTISPEMIKKSIAFLEYTRAPGNFVHISEII